MHTHLMYISQAELEYFVSQDAAGICKAKQGMICEDSLHSRRTVQCIVVTIQETWVYLMNNQTVVTKDGRASRKICVWRLADVHVVTDASAGHMVWSTL